MKPRGKAREAVRVLTQLVALVVVLVRAVQPQSVLQLSDANAPCPDWKVVCSIPLAAARG